MEVEITETEEDVGGRLVEYRDLHKGVFKNAGETREGGGEGGYALLTSYDGNIPYVVSLYVM